MDAKLFLSFRPAEEAKHLEVCHMLAERLGGYEPDPGEAGLARASNHPFGQAALDADIPVEAYIAALGALDDQLDLNLYLGHLRAARDEVVRTALRLIAGDRGRHVAFAWAFLGSRVPRWTPGRAAVIDTVREFLAHVVLGGYRNAWLLPEKSREPWLAAEEETARHGLGASTMTQERGWLRAYHRAGARAARQLGSRAAGRRSPRARDDLGRQGESSCSWKGAHRSLRPRAALSVAAALGHARRVGLWQRAKTLSGIRRPTSRGRPSPGALQRRAAAGRADVLEPADVGEYGAISEARRCCCASRSSGGCPICSSSSPCAPWKRSSRRGLVADGRAPGPVLPQPENPPTAGAVGTHGVRRMAFDPDTSLEGIFASLVRCRGRS
jgi:hypothetical protein